MREFANEEISKDMIFSERYCSDTFPGPSVSAFGSHEMRVVFTSGSSGTANGFKALFEIRTARKEDVPHGGKNKRKFH